MDPILVGGDTLTERGSDGDFIIVHGRFQTCADAHGEPFNEHFWIVTQPRECEVFVTIRDNPSDYISAGEPGATPTRYRGPGHCHCGHGH